MSNLKMCSGSKPHTLGQEALVPKFLDGVLHHVYVKTFHEKPFLNSCDWFCMKGEEYLYMNSMNIKIHVLIELTCL